MEGGTGFPRFTTRSCRKAAGRSRRCCDRMAITLRGMARITMCPDWQNSQAGPFDLWPTGLGFEYFYGFIGGDTSQWAPAIFEGIKPIEPPHGDTNYFFDKDMADHCIDRIRMLHAMAPDKPWLQYYANRHGACAHHAPKDWIAKFKGQFDMGWDKMREETLARQKGDGRCSRGHAIDGTFRRNPCLGFVGCRSQKSFCAHDGGLCRRVVLLRFPDEPHP